MIFRTDSIEKFKTLYQYMAANNVSITKASEALSIPKTSAYNMARSLQNGEFDREGSGLTAAEHKDLLFLLKQAPTFGSGGRLISQPNAPKTPKAPNVDKVVKARKVTANGQLICLAGDAASVIKAMSKMDFSKIVGK